MRPGADADGPESPVRNLVLLFADQMDGESAALDGFNGERDVIWMAEEDGTATRGGSADHLRCHKVRLVFFLSAMRHFRDDQRRVGRRVHYHQLDPDGEADRGPAFRNLLREDLRRLCPAKLILCRPGSYHALSVVASVASECGVEVEVREDSHFLIEPEWFAKRFRGRKAFVLEHFYRTLRRERGVLLTEDGTPVGGEWNYDRENRESFGREGPGRIPEVRRFPPDRITEAIIKMVAGRFKSHPGSLDRFDLPVTRDQALVWLRDFVTHRLSCFGAYEDAMWSEEPVLYHSRLSALLNVKLLSPRETVDSAIAAYEAGDAPLNSVEGFVRQVLGWREFVRGVYWYHMPEYAQSNALECDEIDVPGFFWDGETDMNCVAGCMLSVVTHAWTHHIPRLMVLGQFALLLGVHPYRFHLWHMAMYVDAIDWVSLPNALGMSQYGDGGIMGTKPYCASGNYINKMSNFCRGCRYRYNRAVGSDACPFTTLYWDFLDRHHRRFSLNRRMLFQIRNLERKEPEELAAIRKRAAEIRAVVAGGGRI